jgi:L,D-peptidoglycan transpeptidase YkuD (ErfK/YbiS/YcfS/YnhG family)
LDDAGWAVVTPEGHFRFEGQTLRCALGKGGVVAATRKQEGDGATPAARLPLRRVLYRADRGPAPACAVAVEPLDPADGWCDDAADRAYNRPVRLPFGGRHEVLWRADAIYDVIGVLGWNDAPVERGRGSAIFLHLARPDFSPTEGCVALAPGDLRLVLSRGLRGLTVLG